MKLTSFLALLIIWPVSARKLALYRVDDGQTTTRTVQRHSSSFEGFGYQWEEHDQEKPNVEPENVSDYEKVDVEPDPSPAISSEYGESYVQPDVVSQRNVVYRTEEAKLRLERREMFFRNLQLGSPSADGSMSMSMSMSMMSEGGGDFAEVGDPDTIPELPVFEDHYSSAEFKVYREHLLGHDVEYGAQSTIDIEEFKQRAFEYGQKKMAEAAAAAAQGEEEEAEQVQNAVFTAQSQNQSLIDLPSFVENALEYGRTHSAAPLQKELLDRGRHLMDLPVLMQNALEYGREHPSHKVRRRIV